MSDTQGTRHQTAGRQKQSKNDEGRMPLADHLRELRNRLAVSILALLVGTVLGFLVHNWILHQMTGPICSIKALHGVAASTPGCPNGVLVVDGPLGGLSLSFDVSMMLGVIISSPVWSYQLWAFLAPGLYKKERKYGLTFVGAAVPLFLGGAAIAYWVFPKAIRILLSFVPPGMAQMIQGADFLTFFIRMVLVFGLSFEIPLLMVGLNFIGILSAAKLRSWWRAIVFIIFVFAAVATPTGDPLTMTVLAVPICLLFFVALGVATLHDRSKAKRRALEDPDSLLDDDVASTLDLAPSEVPSQGTGPLERVTASELASREPMVYHSDDDVT
ncbi:twin-arginine translocase subunit TatC [Streptacidiphilus sp. PB12-B1b]|uniref:twin-arginine translocase subunit TatC n=1 Tax=Streptacidiphilus sp. PB12-B1b TaxID=2705012 RepID=UPI0015F8D3DB|nr:twin-arginine translocase subunit TatC [Streptacidiphilus sp. PB12-B1b]QMU76322.1 twin-arginine translocase subunit TatC [Streptacidiphilus sp. PB12-B1b]